MKDYKKRMKDEYTQLKERTDKLDNMLDKYHAGELDFEPTCPIWLLNQQLATMQTYVDILEARAKIEDVDLKRDE